MVAPGLRWSTMYSRARGSWTRATGISISWRLRYPSPLARRPSATSATAGDAGTVHAMTANAMTAAASTPSRRGRLQDSVGHRARVGAGDPARWDVDNQRRVPGGCVVAAAGVAERRMRHVNDLSVS